MSDLAAQRRFYAEEIQVAANLQSPTLVAALASVPRERFLPAGPWTLRSQADFGGPLRQTPDADPRHVYHNVAIGIDPPRMLFNGQPALIAMAIDALRIAPGERVLHIGTATGYFTALLACCASPTGHVVGVEIDDGLAARASANLAGMPWAEIRCGDGSGLLGERFDAILVNAGVTHPLETWLDALAPGGRLIFPLTATMNVPGPMGNIGKGPMLLVTRNDPEHPPLFAVRPVTFVAIYSALGIRDEALNAEIGKGLQKNPFPPLKTLRRDPHEQTEACWLHAPGFCLGM